MSEQLVPSRIGAVDVPVSLIHPNAWNPNTQSEQVQRAMDESLEMYGFVETILLRPHPQIEGEYEIVNGEHRWRDAIDLGVDTVPAVVRELSDYDARKLTIILNETKGEADVVRLGQVLQALADMNTDPGDLLKGLPYTSAEAEHLKMLANVDWDDFGGDVPSLPPREEDDEWFTVAARLPDSFRPVWDRVLEIADERGVEHTSGDIRAGMIVEMLAAEFLAGPVKRRRGKAEPETTP